MPKLRTRPPRMYRDRGRAYVKIDGQRIPLGPWGSDEAREAYDRLVSEWLAHGRRLPAATAEDETPTVAEVAVTYAAHRLQRNPEKSLDRERQALKTLRKLYGSTPADQFGPKRLAVIREELIGRKLARATVSEYLAIIRAAFRHAAAIELIDAAVHQRLAVLDPVREGDVKRPTKDVKPVPRRHLRLARRQMPRPVRGLVDLQLLTGARPGELVNLRALDIDTTGRVWAVDLARHKSAGKGKSRTIYIGPKAQRVLRPFMLGRAVDRPLFDPREANAEGKRRGTRGGRRENQKPNPTRTGRTIGEAYTTASYRRAIERACDAAGVTRWTPHRLRHNAGTALRRQFGIEAARVILGHASADVTAIYAEANANRARDVIGRVG